MTKAYKPLLQSIGLTYPQYLAMLVLWEGDGITVGDISAALAERYGLDRDEAGLAVAEFLRQLGRRGAVGFVAPKGDKEKAS